MDELHSEVLQIGVGEDTPGWWEAIYKPPAPGSMGPDDPNWGPLIRGLKDEYEGTAPDQEPDELSDWCRSWVRHIAETLDLTLVIPSTGYLDGYATMSDPRE